MVTTRVLATRQGSLPQATAVLIGVTLVLLGLLAYLVTGFGGFAAHQPDLRLFGLAVNPLQNLLHLLAGAAGIVLSTWLVWSRRYGWLVVVGFGALFGFGVLAVARPSLNVLNLNWAANWLHLAIALAGLLAAIGPARPGLGLRLRKAR